MSKFTAERGWLGQDAKLPELHFDCCDIDLQSNNPNTDLIISVK